MNNDISNEYQNYPVTKLGDLEFAVKRIDSFCMNVPIKIYANESMVASMASNGTISQAVNVSTLAGVVRHVAIIPDGHKGYGFPVGGVAAMDIDDGVISPGGVGYDINCGVRLLQTNLNEKDISSKIIEIVNELFHTIPTSLEGKTKTKLNDSQLDDILFDGMNWTVRNGYGLASDLAVCEENGNIGKADTSKASYIAKKRNYPTRKFGIGKSLS